MYQLIEWENKYHYWLIIIFEDEIVKVVKFNCRLKDITSFSINAGEKYVFIKGRHIEEKLIGESKSLKEVEEIATIHLL